MSKLGETVDRVLELLNEKEKLGMDELHKKVPSTDSDVLNFMKQEGFVKLRKGEVSITKFGSELLTAGRLP